MGSCDPDASRTGDSCTRRQRVPDALRWVTGAVSRGVEAYRRFALASKYWTSFGLVNDDSFQKFMYVRCESERGGLSVRSCNVP